MGYVPKRANPNEANQIMNMIVEQEVKFWPAADRMFVMPSDSRLKLNTVTANVNARDPEMSRRLLLRATATTEAYCAGRISNLVEKSRRIDKVLDTPLPIPKERKKAIITESDIQGVRKFKHEPNRTDDGIPIRLPERSCEAIGFAHTHKFAHTMAKYSKRRSPGPLVKYAENYLATLGNNPYAGKPMFPSRPKD